MEALTYEELTRKCLDTMEVLALRHEQGVLSNREFKIAVDAVWGVTSGVVHGMAELTSEVADMKLEAEPVQVVMSNGDNVFVIGRNGINVSIMDAKTFKESGFKVFFTEAEAAEHVRKLVAAFEKKGFKRVC